MRSSFLRRVLDGKDRSTEAHTVLTVVAFVFLVVFQGYALWKGQDFSAAAFGQALGIVMGGGSVAALGQGYLNRAPTQRRSTTPDNPDA